MTKTIEEVQKITIIPNEKRLKQLKQLYPECLTEGGFDLEKLKGFLSTESIEKNGVKCFLYFDLNISKYPVQICRRIASLVLMLFFHVSLLHAQSVRLIYFYPTDHAAPKSAKMDECGKIAREAQSFYRKQMLDNGFGEKTFELEGMGDSITIYTVMGSRDTQHYATNRWEQIITEISGVKSDINLILVEGLEVLTNNIGAVMVRSCSGNKCTTDHHTFYAIVPLKTDEPVVGAAHELGHAFGLQHNRDNDSLMVGARQVDGKHPTIESMHLRNYEIRWLDKHKYFNNDASVNDPQLLVRYGKQSGKMTMR
ncbi:hypothetical protein F4X10_14410 [Candidatus Poribacteria bacterium]|nr:hypothetical protein [Candidatus Poribacteria bacterium]